MTIWICSYPRCGNSLVAASLLTTGQYRYEQYGATMVRPDGVERAIAAGRLPQDPSGELVYKTHRISDAVEAPSQDRIIVPIRDGRDALVSFWHYGGVARAKDMISFWDAIHGSGYRWDDWMRNLRLLQGRAVTFTRFEEVVGGLQWMMEGRGLKEAAPDHFRSGQVGQWRELPAAEQQYLNRELATELTTWGYAPGEEHD